MFRLIKLLFSLIVLAALWYAATTYQLGNKTLWAHLKAIAGSDESKALVQEVKKKADEVKKKVVTGDAGPLKKVKERVKKKAVKAAADQLTAEERDALRELIKKKSEEEKEPPKAEAEAKP